MNSPTISRAHDIQRILSYGVGIAVGLVLDVSAWQTVVITGTGLIMVLTALYRVATKRVYAPYVIAQADHAIAGAVIAVATASPIITAAAGMFIAGAIAASFDAPPRIGVTLATIWLVPQVVVSILVERGSAEEAPYLSVVVLIMLLLTLATVILGFFAVQSRKLQQKLRYRETQLEAVLNTAPVLLATIDEADDVTTLSAYLEAQWSELISDSLHATPEIAAVVTEARSGNRAKREITVSDRVFSVTCDPGADGTILLAAYDITSQANARDHLVELVRSKDQFIAAVSHELRTPLSSVLGFAEVIQEMSEEDETLRPLISEVVSQSAEMAAIIDDLLVAARSSFEEIATSARPIDLAAEVVSVIESIDDRIENRVRCDATGPVPAFADAIRVRQILRNLITNADRYGGTDIWVTAKPGTETAIIEVRDSGDPIPDQLRDRIFEPYESSGPVRGQPAAIGLGLSVSRTLAELMGGSLAYRHDDTWSIFELCLPARESAIEQTTQFGEAQETVQSR